MNNLQQLSLAGLIVALVAGGTVGVGPAVDYDDIWIASFNIKFLGNSNVRDDEALADLLVDYDVVVVQELVSPPFPGSYPDGTAMNPDPQSAEFFDAMAARGFEFVLSPEDTSRGANNHRNGSTTEWFVAFYNPDTVEVADDLPFGFLEPERAANPTYDRVPFAFPFRTRDARSDMVLVSVHFRQGTGPTNRGRRQTELAAVATWIDEQDGTEQDYIILGDMNFHNCAEMQAALPAGFESLNDGCDATNTNPFQPRPFDHIMVRTAHTAAEVDPQFRFGVIDLVTEMRGVWPQSGAGPYPGDPPFNGNQFAQFFSDHHPVDTVLIKPDADDD